MKDARALGPVWDPFRQALADGYKVQADTDYAEYHMESADRFYRKSVNAATGRDLALEDPGNYSSLNVRDRREVAAMRPAVAAWIDANKKRDPQAAANLQLRFDCWVEEMSERDYEDAARCKPVVGPVAQAIPAPVAPAPVPAPAPVAASCERNPDGTDKFGKLCREGVVFFAFDRYDLLDRTKSGISKQTVNQQTDALDLIVRQAVAAKARRLDVYGRADASGPGNYNYGLSDCRARSVVDGLKARGLPSKIDVVVIPLGQTSPIEQTGDNVRNAANRVVMVAIQTDRNAPLARQPVPSPQVDLFGCGTARHPYPLPGPSPMQTTAATQ
jgi:OOP family OmpA-OmpF porin